MKQIFKKGLVTTLCMMLLLCVALVLGACGDKTPDNTLPNANETAGDGTTVASGLTEDGITWVLYNDGLLQLAGDPVDGKMYDYKFENEVAPWKEYVDQVTALEISGKINLITEEAFAGMKNLIWVQLFNSTVTTLDDGAFKNCTNLRRVILPDTVTTIGEVCFSGCYRLWEVSLGAGVATIDEEAFSGCTSLLTVKLNDSLKDTGVAANAFLDCNRLVEVVTSRTDLKKGSASFGGVAKVADRIHSGESELVVSQDGFISLGSRLVGYNGSDAVVTIPESVENIGSYAFYANTLVEEIVVGDSVKTIGDGAFSCCENLEKVTLGKKVNTIGNVVFDNCWNIKEVTLNASALTKAPMGLFEDCQELATVTFGREVSSLPAGLFSNCLALTEVKLPTNLTKIEASLFENCKNLEKIETGTSITTIGANAFRNCQKLAEFPFAKQKSITTIGENAFSNCSSFITLDLTTVVGVKAAAFSGCTSLTSVVIGSKTGLNDEEIFRGCRKLVDVVNNKTGMTLRPGRDSYGFVAYYTPFSIGKGSSRLVKEGDYLFMTDADVHYLVGYTGSSKNLTLPNSYKGQSYYVNAYAFYGNMQIESVTMGASVLGVGDQAFSNCAALKSVDMASASVAALGNNAFAYCSALSTITLPQTTLVSIGEYAFAGCESLTTLRVPNSVTTMGSRALADSGMVELVLGTGVTELADYLLSGCANLKRVTFANNTVSIGEGTFARCSSLAEVTIPNTVKTIGMYAFYGCEGLYTVVLPDGLERLGVEAFKRCYSLYSVTLGTGTPVIGERAFRDCSKLVEVINRSNLELKTGEEGPGMITTNAVIIGGANATSQAGLENNYLYMVMGTKTYLMGYLGTETNLTLPTTLNGSKYSIYRYSFYNTTVKNVIIPDEVGDIGGYAFMNSDLETITIGKNVRDIGAYAFSLTPLKSITFSADSKLERIGMAAFEGCDRLLTIDIPDDVEELSAAAFRGCTRLHTIHLSEGLVKIGAYAFDDCYSLIELTIPEYVTSIGRDWSSNCYNLVQVYNKSKVSITNKGLTTKQILNVALTSTALKLKETTDGLVFYVDGNVVYLVGYKGTATELVLPDRFEGKSYVIYNYAFYGRDDLTSVTIGKYCTGIGERAFAECSSLKSIYMSTNLINDKIGVGAYLFENCAEDLLVVCGYATKDEIPTNWNAEWNKRNKDGTVYLVYYGYTQEQYLALIGK